MSTEAPSTVGTLLSDSDKDFITNSVSQVTGWLSSDAAYFTTYLMNRQSQSAIRGPALEFGVYHGKYLCLMLHSCLKHGEWVGGFDTFELCHPETAWVHAEELFGKRDMMALWKGSTATFSAEQVKSMIGSPPRIVSVDGDHTSEGAFHDMKLAAQVVHRDGVLSVDDVYNPIAIGVAEGTFRFLLSKDCDLVPFALIANKTFMCHKAKYDFYSQVARDFTRDCPELDIVKSFEINRAQGENWVIQRLVGKDVLLFNQAFV